MSQATGKLKVLFVGAAESSHTYAWIELLKNDSRFEARLFGTPGAGPEEDCPVPAYNTCPYANYKRKQDRSMYPVGINWIKYAGLSVATGRMHWLESAATWWLRRLVKSWKPDIVHTLGVFSAGTVYQPIHLELGQEKRPKWVVTIRGGTDTTLQQYDPKLKSVLMGIFKDADTILTDTLHYVRLLKNWGIDGGKFPAFQAVSGVGGIDPAISDHALDVAPETRRLILWPRAYEIDRSKSLPVLSAIRQVWNRIQPCRIALLSTDVETRKWLATLPAEIRGAFDASPRISRSQVLEMMRQARVMLAPALMDGTPNSMFEAMAYGALPIVSPLETLMPIVRDGEHVLFARNLYPDEIAHALDRAMNDVELLRSITRTNQQHVKVVANRLMIQRNIVNLYTGLAAGEKLDTIAFEKYYPSWALRDL